MPRVLVVDDSQVALKLAAGLVEKLQGWTVQTAADGAEALHSLTREEFDLVLTDLQMPALNGLELTKEIRQHFPQLPVVLMTAQGSEEIATQALQAGAAGYVPKRCLATDLAPVLRRVLSAATEERSQQQLFQRLQQRSESYILESDLPLLLTMSRYLQQLIGESWSIDRTERLRIGTAIEEALLNAYYHGSLEAPSSLKEEDFGRFNELVERRLSEPQYRDRRIAVRLDLSPATVRITIRDEGPGFDPAALPDPSHPEYLERLSGRGVMLMRSFMDEVQFNGIGNEVAMIKHRS